MTRTHIGYASLVVAISCVVATFGTDTLRAQGNSRDSALPSVAKLRSLLQAAPRSGGDAGGLFSGARMWAAVVARNGQVCAATTSTDDATQVWPGSQAIAKAKAYTANAFSIDALALSTARLFTFTQPGHSLWSLGQSNLYNSDLLQAPGAEGDRNQIAGGLIAGEFLVFSGEGDVYSTDEVTGWLGDSGWRFIEHTPLAGPHSLIVAETA